MNRGKCLHLCPSQQITSRIHIIYPSAGHGMGLQCWSHSRGCSVVCSHSNSSSPLPAAVQSHDIALALVYIWLIDKKSRLTCLLYLVLSHWLEKRPFHCAANLWETRAVQCKRLGNLSFVFHSRPGRSSCILVWLWLLWVCLLSVSDLQQMFHISGKNALISTCFIKNSWTVS